LAHRGAPPTWERCHMTYQQQIDRFCRVVAMLIRRLLEAAQKNADSSE